MSEYCNLKGELAKNNISKTKVAEVLGLHINTVTNKLEGSSSFSIEEAFKIKTQLLPYCDLSYLFARPQDINSSRQAS
jgi:hypothetical protein